MRGRDNNGRRERESDDSKRAKSVEQDWHGERAGAERKRKQAVRYAERDMRCGECHGRDGRKRSW